MLLYRSSNSLFYKSGMYFSFLSIHISVLHVIKYDVKLQRRKAWKIEKAKRLLMFL